MRDMMHKHVIITDTNTVWDGVTGRVIEYSGGMIEEQIVIQLDIPTNEYTSVVVPVSKIKLFGYQGQTELDSYPLMTDIPSMVSEERAKTSWTEFFKGLFSK